jgi:alanine racemase
MRHRLEIDLGAVRANAARLRDTAGGAALYAVVKADGYGHGAVACGQAALDGGAERLCVATIEEAEELRAALGPEVPIVVLAPLVAGQEDRAAGFEVVVSSAEALERLHAAGVPAAVHVKADTGMGRWGMTGAEALDAGRALASDALAPLRLAGLCSHLATADDPDQSFLNTQVQRFAELAAVFPRCPRHLANSAATLWAPQAHWDAVRCGIALYGVSPSDGDPAQDGLEPAMRWTAAVAAVRTLSPGESAGYGRRLVADEPTTVALVPVGYADGYPRALSGRGDVLIGGRRRRVAATVSMDQLTAVVDPGVRPGDEVVLIGRQGEARIGPEELGRLAGTIGYEICCRAGRRGARVSVPGSSRPAAPAARTGPTRS